MTFLFQSPLLLLQTLSHFFQTLFSSIPTTSMYAKYFNSRHAIEDREPQQACFPFLSIFKCCSTHFYLNFFPRLICALEPNSFSPSSHPLPPPGSSSINFQIFLLYFSTSPPPPHWLLPFI